jgi:hypothetical protein
MWRVVTGMTSNPIAQAGTALSPEWDRGIDEALTELISGDPDLVRAEFNALIGASFTEPPAPPAPPAPSDTQPAPTQHPKPRAMARRIPAGPSAAHDGISGRGPPPAGLCSSTTDP